MGFKDLIKSAADKTNDLIKAEMNKKAELKQLQAEQSQMQRVMIQISSGFQQVNAMSTSTMFQRQDGTVYFNTNFHDRYVITGYDWSGPRFETTISSNTSSTGHEYTKGKSGKMLAGATIGALAGPPGMIVGAAIGAGGNGKKSRSSQAYTNSIQRQNVLLTPANLKLRNLDTGPLLTW